MQKVFVIGQFSKYKYNIKDGIISSDDIIIEFKTDDDMCDAIKSLLDCDTVIICNITNSKDQLLLTSIAKRVQKNIIYINGESRIQSVLSIASDFFKIPVSDILGKSRRDDIASVRFIVCYALRNIGYSTLKIGSVFNRNYSTVIHACRVVEDIMSYDKKYAEKVNLFIKEISE